MSQTVPEGRIEPVVSCPYCDEPVLRRSLFGHVSVFDDEAHGERGTVPDDFDSQQPEPADYLTVRAREEPVDTESRILCRHCHNTFNGKHGLEVHLGMKRGDSNHPEDATVENSGIPISVYDKKEPPQPKVAEQDGAVSAYRNRLKSMTRPPGETAGPVAESVPIEPLLDLLDDYRRHESEGAAYVTCARMLQSVLEEHNAIRR